MSKLNPLNIPLRFQWNTNYGYCGEVCFISAGLMLGQYLSQYDVRQISHFTYPNACKVENTNNISNTTCRIQGSKNKSQLLLGVNDNKVATKLNFTYERWDNRKEDTLVFLDWVKKMFLENYIVIIGVYQNFYFFNARIPNYIGDLEYDHIVLVTKITDTELYINDLGNYASYLMYVQNPDDPLYDQEPYYNTPSYKNINYIYSIPYPSGILNREDTDENKYLKYTIPLYQKNTVGNYGIAIKGMSNTFINKTLLPIYISVNKNYEFPSTIDNSDDKPYNIYSNIRPASINLILTITISNLIIENTYCIYKFNDIDYVNYTDSNIINISIASNNFNLSADDIIYNDTSPFYFTATNTIFVFKDYITSNQQCIYKCISA
jgi:hypothetical protein